MGLISFWLSNEDTYGAIEEMDYQEQPFKAETKELNQMFAMLSREKVLENEMFKKLFKPFAAAIGIDKDQEIPEWEEIRKKLK